MKPEDLIGRDITEVPTPSFVVDVDKVKRNSERMIERCEQFGVRLRPHMKTSKTLEAGNFLTNGTKRCVVVSTLQEAEFFADGGYDDILYGCLITEDKLQRCKQLAKRLEKFHLMIDSCYALKLLESSPLDGDKKWSVVLKVDCGYGRAGVQWNSDVAVSVGKDIANSRNVNLLSLYTHCGNSYGTKSLKGLEEVEEETVDRLVHLRDRLKAAGVHNIEIGTGSTPTCSRPIGKLQDLNELHPGNYVFYDWMQVNIGSCSLDDVACRIATRVIGHYPEKGQILIDAGFTALEHNGLNANLPMKTGFTFIQDNPNLKITCMTQEVGFVKAVEGEIEFEKHPVGSLLFVYPYHSCATAAMHSFYYVHSGSTIKEIWRPTRGW